MMAYTEQAHLFYHYNTVINVGLVRGLFQTSFEWVIGRHKVHTQMKIRTEEKVET